MAMVQFHIIIEWSRCLRCLEKLVHDEGLVKWWNVQLSIESWSSIGWNAVRVWDSSFTCKRSKSFIDFILILLCRGLHTTRRRAQVYKNCSVTRIGNVKMACRWLYMFILFGRKNDLSRIVYIPRLWLWAFARQRLQYVGQ